MLDGFLNLIDNVNQTEGVSATDILRGIVNMQQQVQESQLNNDRARVIATRQYQEQVAQKAAENARLQNFNAINTIQNQIRTNNSLLDFKNQISDQNIDIYSANISAIQSAISRDRQTTLNVASARAGAANATLAGNGIIVGSGSGKQLTNNIISDTLKEGQTSYADKMNRITGVLNAIRNTDIEKESNALATQNTNIALVNRANVLSQQQDQLGRVS